MVSLSFAPISMFTASADDCMFCISDLHVRRRLVATVVRSLVHLVVEKDTLSVGHQSCKLCNVVVVLKQRLASFQHLHNFSRCQLSQHRCHVWAVRQLTAENAMRRRVCQYRHGFSNPAPLPWWLTLFLSQGSGRRTQLWNTESTHKTGNHIVSGKGMTGGLRSRARARLCVISQQRNKKRGFSMKEMATDNLRKTGDLLRSQLTWYCRQRPRCQKQSQQARRCHSKRDDQAVATREKSCR